MNVYGIGSIFILIVLSALSYIGPKTALVTGIVLGICWLVLVAVIWWINLQVEDRIRTHGD